MSTPARFDHEKLDVYQAAIAFSAWSGQLLDGPLVRCRLSAVKQLDRASTSIPLNLAEGNGKRSPADRGRYLDIARGSALESAACLDVRSLGRPLLWTRPNRERFCWCVSSRCCQS